MASNRILLSLGLIGLTAGWLCWWQHRPDGAQASGKPAVQAAGKKGWTVPVSAPVELPAEALALWLKADKGIETTGDGLLLSWQDGAAGKTLASPVDVPAFNAKGIGGKPCIVFNRTNPLKIDLGEKWPTDELTIFAVSQCSEPQKGENNLFQVFPLQNGNLFQAHLPHQNGNAYWDVGGNRTSFRCPDGAKPQIWEFIAKPGTGQAMSCNGAQKATVKTSGKFDPAGKQLHLGRAFQGELAELIIYSQALDEAARNRIGAYLAKKHGIESTYKAVPQDETATPAIANNVLWLKADAGVRQDTAGNVLVWEDQSPGKHHATLPTLPKRIELAPGRFAVRFSGAQKLAMPLPAAWPTKEMDIFLVIRRAKEKPGFGSLLAVAPAEKNPFSLGVPCLDGEIRLSVGTHNFLADCANPGSPQIIECSATAGKGKVIAINGIPCATSLVDSTFVPGERKLIIGEGFNGDIAEIVVYNRALSPQERHQAGFHLAQKYDIAATYPIPVPRIAAAIDFKDAREITAIQAVFAEATPIPYLIEGSVDGKLWKPIVDNRLAELPAALHEFDPVTVQHLRLIPELQGNDKMPALSEFRAWRQQEIPAGMAGPKPTAPVWPNDHPGLTAPQYNLLPDTYAWILAHNKRQVIDAKFLETAPVPSEILLPDGQVEPLQKIKQLFDYNFRVFHYPTGLYDTPENREILKVLSERYRRQLARPLLWEYVTNHAWHHNPAEGSQSYDAAIGTYNRFRRANRNLPTFTYSMGAAGMSNGSNVALATWIKFEISGWPFHIMTHETSHCLGFNDGCNFAYGFDGYMAGKFGAREWAYDLIDPNQIPLVELPRPALPRLPAVPLAGMTPREKLPATAFRNPATGASPLTLAGITFASGIGLASDVPVSFEIPPAATRFVAVAGLDDAERANTLAGCVLEVYADDSLIARSPQLAANSRRWWTIDANIPAGAKALRLLARNTIDNRKGKTLIPVQTAWCNAGFAFVPPVQVTKAAAPAIEPNPRCYTGTQLITEKTVEQIRHQLAYYPNGAKRWETATLVDGTWDGPHRQWFADGSPQVEETYRNGKLQGLRSEWYDNGKKRSEKSFKDGILDGAVSLWRNDGTLSMQFTCKEGKTEGVVRKFQPDGKTAQLEENHTKGILYGQKRSFHANGKVAEEWDYTNGVLNGAHVRYDANSLKIFAETLVENQLQGTQTSWYPSGKKQIEANYKDNQLDGNRTVWHANGEVAEKSFYTHGLQDGSHIKYYPTGARQMEETFIKNQIHGLQTHWYADGKKYIEVNYKDNRINGIRTVWHTNGAVAETSVYSNGLLDGPHATFSNQGKKQLEETYVKNLLHGIRKTWHGNGSKYQEHSFRDGKLDGLRLDWFADGKPQFEENYRNGVKSGRCRQWDAKGNVVADQVCEAKVEVFDGVKETKAANGNVTCSQTYENSLLHGKSRWYHANGKVAKEMTYVKGHIDGPYGEWYNTGTPYVACIYHDDVIDGERTVWHANGQIAEKAVYSGNLLDGMQVKYYADGKKQCETVYVKNLLHGPRTTWHANGQKQCEELFKDNLLTEKRLAWHANGKPQVEENYLNGRKEGRCCQWDANGKVVSDKVFKNGKPQE